MRFDVVAPTVPARPGAPDIPANTDLTPGIDPYSCTPVVGRRPGVLTPPSGITVRQLTLNETFDATAA